MKQNALQNRHRRKRIARRKAIKTYFKHQMLVNIARGSLGIFNLGEDSKCTADAER